MQGQVCVVIGGSGAIGSAICRHFAHAGARCIPTYNNNEQAARDLVGSLPGGGHWTKYVPVDVSTAIKSFAREVEEREGRLDVLVNCAGITRFVPHADLDALDDELIDDIFRVNWRGAFAAVRAFRDLLRAGEGGLIINVSSIAGVTAMGSNVAYCASKAALDSMTKSLARALAPEIRVVSLSPGLVDTEFVKGLDKKWRDEQAARTPLKRLARAEEVGAAALAVATHLKYSTGCIIPVDGGRPLA
ncbi:MAG TPA: SDR family oxidoreductase [Burkholderiales bacterium]|jgi:3-oxoacyl-[acyl-carrier protein] reductase|nr:SDR family oxidoreductase [Burkholderiales bacterium]